MDARRTNTDKVLYPAVGFTKGEVLDHWERTAPVLLPHVRARPASFKRFPDGVDEEGFFQKNAPRGTPEWVRTVELDSPGSTKGRRTVEYVVADDVETLLWAGNLACLEIHVPQWRVGPRGGVRLPDQLVFDLDPGAPATLVDCCRVALLLREELAADGLEAWPKVSGAKGLHLHVPVKPVAGPRATAYTREVAARLAGREPGSVVTEMARELREGKVFVDWNQNNPARTTIAPYSLRARREPTVAAPVTWDEVAGCDEPAALRFLARDLPERLDRFGDLMEEVAAGNNRIALPK